MRIAVAIILISLVARAEQSGSQSGVPGFVMPQITIPTTPPEDQDRKKEAEQANQAALAQMAASAAKAAMYMKMAQDAEARGDQSTADMMKMMAAMEGAQAAAARAAAAGNKKAAQKATSVPPVQAMNFPNLSPSPLPSETPDDDFSRLGEMMTPTDEFASSPAPTDSRVIEAVPQETEKPAGPSNQFTIRTENEKLQPMPDQNLTFNEKTKATDGESSGGSGRGLALTSGPGNGNGLPTQNGEVNVSGQSLADIHPGLRTRARGAGGADSADIVGSGSSEKSSGGNAFESLMSQFMGGGNNVEGQWAAINANSEVLMVKGDTKKQNTIFDIARNRFEKALYEEQRISSKPKQIPTRATASVSNP